MRKLKLIVPTVILACGLSALAADAGASWRAKMHALSDALKDTIPLLYPDPSIDGKELTKKIQGVYEASKALDGKFIHAGKLPDDDPALPYLAGLLTSDIERAYRSAQEGHLEYAKSVVRASVSYCIACHSRSGGGAQFPLLSAFTEPLKKVSWIERIEFQAASRQYDTVLTEVNSRLAPTGGGDINSMDLEVASRMALSILVRVKKSPEEAAALAKRIIQSPAATTLMKERAAVWLGDTEEWRKEAGRKYATEDELLTAAGKLTGQESDGDLPFGQNREVRLLRAAALMHELLVRYPKGQRTAEAFYIIGMTYDALQDLGLWSLHEVYFMACIKHSPHTDISERCFRRYKDSITLGYTGSGGVHVPASVRKHLKTVGELAAKPARDRKAP